MREVIRHAYGDEQDTSGAAARLRAYVGTVQGYQQALGATADREGRVSLESARQKSTRQWLEGYLEFVGLDLKERRKVHRVERKDGSGERARRAVLEQAGLDLAGLEKALNAGEPFVGLLPEDQVPLPLPAAAWSHVFDGPVPFRQLAWAILLNRDVALFYHGLTALDPDTCSYLAATPELLKRLCGAGAVFSTFSNGFRIRDGRVVVPGGRPAEFLWEALVGEPPTPVIPFARKLFSAADGKVAYFYDALSRLDPAHLAFALGTHERDREARLARFLELHAAAGSLFLNWTPSSKPFLQIAGDAASVLARVEVDSDGRLPGPAWSRLWDKVFDDLALPADAASEAKRIDRDGTLDAAALVRLLCVGEFQARLERTATFLFAQRVFPAAGPEDAAPLLVALRGARRHPVLSLTLERMGVAEPALYDRAALLASRLSAIPDVERRACALAGFQGALGLIERVRFVRTLDVATTSRLVEALVALPLSEEGEYLGHLAAWVETLLLPALEKGVGHPEAWGSHEELVLASLAGVRHGNPPAERVTWEELPYRVDRPGAAKQRLERIRQRQGDNRLDAGLGFARAAATLASDVKTLDRLKAAVAGARTTAKDLHVPRRFGLEGRDPVPDVRATVERAVQAALKIKKAKDLRKLARIALPLVRLADAALAETLASLACLPSLADARALGSFAGDLAARHDFGLAARDEAARARTPWTIPTSVEGASGRHLLGSLLALDVALARFTLRRVSEDRIPAPPTLNEGDRQSIAEMAAFANGAELHDAERDLLATSVRRGTARVNSVSPTPSSLRALTEASGLAGWRTEALAWALVHEPDAVARSFTLSELVRIGLDSAPGVSLDAWGTSDLALGGRLGLRWPRLAGSEYLEGHFGAAGLTPRLPDPWVWVAVALADRNLPAELAGEVLAFVAQDFIDEAQLLHANDWLSAADYVRGLPAGRLDDYVAALTSGGALVPESQGHDNPAPTRR